MMGVYCWGKKRHLLASSMCTVLASISAVEGNSADMLLIRYSMYEVYKYENNFVTTKVLDFQKAFDFLENLFTVEYVLKFFQNMLPARHYGTVKSCSPFNTIEASDKETTFYLSLSFIGNDLELSSRFIF